MQLPYSALELNIALLSIESKLTEETIDGITNAVNAAIPRVKSHAELNKAVADYNGISLEQLINSPNMTAMVKEYQAYNCKKVIANIEKLGFTNKESWALLVTATDAAQLQQ